MEGFVETLRERVVLFDGAMGTEIYARGVFINRSYDSVNLSKPELVRSIHEDFVNAGAEVLTTNTFGANRLRLRPFGLEDQTQEIVASGVRVAKEAAGGRAWVAGSMGPTGARLAPLGTVPPGEAFKVFREQAEVLANEGVDLFLLETFFSLPELWQAVRAVRSVTDLPIVTMMTFPAAGPGQQQTQGPAPAQAAKAMAAWDVAAIGANCSVGPRGLIEIVEAMRPVVDKPIVAMANAGLPQVVEGRTLYLAGPEYMAEHARRLAQVGARGIGGCCGTTPAMIKEMRSFLRSISPLNPPPVTPVVSEDTTDTPSSLPPIPAEERSEFARRLLGGKFCTSVELDPPRGLDPKRTLEGAALLYRAGVDVVNIPDGPRAVARMGPAPLAQLVRGRVPPMESVIHYCCRDRNLLGIQMDLLGAQALGLRNILAVTGDPPKMGTYPNATAVFDIDSIGLISFIQMLNRGQDFSGQPIGGQTSLFVGSGCNPGAVDMDLEADRFLRKVDAGAEFFFSQPVFDPELLHRFLEKTKSAAHVPFLVGIMPLVSSKNAEFLHNEVPGMQIPDPIRKAIKAAPTRKEQREVGIEVASKTLEEVRTNPRIKGCYAFPPFGSYRAVLRVLEPVLETPDDLDAVSPPVGLQRKRA